MEPTKEQLANLARLVSETACDEIDCAEMLDRVADYLHAVTKKQPIQTSLQQVAQHLNVCPECKEEFVALIRAEGIDPATILKDATD